MRTVLVYALSAAVLASAAAAWAQPSAAPPAKDASTAVSGVTVTAPKDIDVKKTFQTKVDKFVESHVTNGPHGKLTRWLNGICPTVAGLTPELNAFVYHRLLAVADQVGVPKPTAKGCRNTNVLVVFTPEPQKLMDDVRVNHPALLGFHYRSERNAVATFQPVIKAWYATASRDAGIDSHLDMAETPCFNGDLRCTPVGAGTGRLTNDLLSEFVHVLVVVDAKGIEGQPIGKVADDVAERALSNPGASRGCSALPSVLDALDQACTSSDTVETLTDYDLAFLKGLYHMETDARIETQRAGIFRELLHDTRPPASGAGG